jgi:hypothetical protein
MSQALTTFHETGWTGWVVLALGVVGMLAGIAALIAAVRGMWGSAPHRDRRSRAALRLGTLAVGAGALCALAGAFGVVHGRTTTDRAIAVERPVQKERHRREGYRRARSAAVVGLAGAVLPLLAGAAAVLAAPRRRPEDADLPPGVPAPRRLLGPVSVTLAGVFCAAIAADALRARLPGRALPVDDPLWDVLDWADVLQTARNLDDARAACRRLGELLDADVGPRAKEAVSGYSAIAAGCVRDRLSHAMALAPAQGIEELEALTRSWFVRSEPDLEQAVQQRVLAIPAAAVPERPTPEVTAGEPIVTGKMPREQIERAFARARPRLVQCYMRSDASYDGVQGEVRVGFTIETIGWVTRVSEESASLEDREIRRCVRAAFSEMHFDKPEGASRVVLPVRFSVAAP